MRPSLSPIEEPVIDPILVSIVLASVVSGVASVCAACLISYTVLSRAMNHLLSLSVGVMLAISLLHTLPEAFASGAAPQHLFALLLAGLLLFFCMEKFAILRHAGAAGASHSGSESHHRHRRGGWMVLGGDSLHNFTDGILIAAAYLADPQLGLLAGLAIIAHEIPQEVGDFIILLHAGFSRRRAFALNIGSSLMALLGGLLGYLTLDRASALIPYVLVLASSGFIYTAISDLMPRLQRRGGMRESLLQMALIVAGVALVVALTQFHSHGGHGHQDHEAAHEHYLHHD